MKGQRVRPTSHTTHVGSINPSLDTILGKTVQSLKTSTPLPHSYPLSNPIRCLIQRDWAALSLPGPRVNCSCPQQPPPGNRGQGSWGFKPQLCNTVLGVLGLQLRWGTGCCEGEGVIPPPELPPCLLWPLTVPMPPASMGPQMGHPGFVHGEVGAVIYF